MPKKKAKKKPEFGTPAYFRAMPARLARNELAGLWPRLKAMESKYNNLRAALQSFKALLDDSE